MTKPNGRYVTMPPGTPAKTPKTYKAGAAMFERRRLEQQQAAMMVQLRQPLENREAETVGPAVAASEEILASTTASIAALAEKEAALNAREALLDARERELSPRSPGGAKQDARAAYAAEQRRALRHKPGGLLDESQSRAILLLYFHLVEMHKRPDKSVEEVATVFGIGKSKVYSVRNRWDGDKTLLTSSAKGRGLTTGEDARRTLNVEQRAKLCKFVTDQYEIGNKVMRRTVAEWAQVETGCVMTDQSAGRLMSKLGFKRRDGTYCA